LFYSVHVPGLARCRTSPAHLPLREGADRRGTYRLARLAARFGAEITLDHLLAKFTVDCDPGHPYHAGCQARFTDLDPPRRPPDDPATTLRVVQGGRR
jgi:hypothetical protein